jgi:hypothetical protein
MKRFVLLVAIVAVGVGVPTAWACQCVRREPTQLGRQAAVVFTGSTTSVSVRNGVTTARFAVAVAYKGRVRARMVIRAPLTSCSFEFRQGKRYTVFAFESAGALQTNICSGTRMGAIRPAKFGLSAKAILT